MKRSLDLFSALLISVYQSCLRRSLATVGLVLLASILAALGLPKQRLLVSYRDLFDSKFQSVRDFNQAESLFSTGNTVLLLAKPKSGTWDTRLLCDYQLWILNQGLDSIEIDHQLSTFSLRETRNTPASIRYPFLLNPDCEHPDSITNLESLKHSPWNGTLYSTKSGDLGTQFVFRDTPGGSRFGKFDPAPIGEVIRSFEQTLGTKIEGIWTGPAMYDFSMRNGMKRMPILNLAVLILLLLLYRAFLGTWRAGFMMALTLILTGMILYGLMAHVGSPVDILSSGLFLMITVAAHQDFSYLSSARLHSQGKTTSLFRRFLVPSFFTSLTTIAGFSSLCVSELSVIARFGFWASIGALLEWIMVLIFLPALMNLFPALKNWVKADRVWIKNPMEGEWAKKLVPSRGLSRLLLVAFLLAPLAVRQANFSDDPKGIFEPSHPFRKALAYLSETRSWEGTMNLVFRTKVNDNFRKSVIEKVKANSVVSRVEGADEISGYFLQSVSGLDREMIKRDLDSTPLLANYLAPSGEQQSILYVNSSDLQTIRAFKEKVLSLCPAGECYLTGPIDLYSEFIFQVSRTLVESLILSLFIVIAIMSFLIKALREEHGVALIVSSLWGPVMMLILVSVFQIPLNAYTCNFASVLVGLAGDNAIQFMFATRRRKLDHGLQTRGYGALFTAVVMSVCSLTFLGSTFHPPKVLGLLLFSGFLLNFYGDYAILKGLIHADVKLDP